MTRPLAVILAATALAVAYAVARIRALGFDLDLTAVPVWAWGSLAVVALASRVVFRAGRYVQAWDHSRRGVLHGHLNLIRGKR